MLSTEEIEEEIQRRADAGFVDVMRLVLSPGFLPPNNPFEHYCRCMKCGPILGRYARCMINFNHARSKEFPVRTVDYRYESAVESQREFYSSACTCGQRTSPRWGPEVRKKVRR